jgi:hypothetical protein
LPHLRGSEGIFRQPWIAEPELDFDHAIAADARAHGQRQAAENELKMRDLQSFARGNNMTAGSSMPTLKSAKVRIRHGTIRVAGTPIEAETRVTEAKLPKEFHLSNVVTFPKKTA